MGKLRIFGENLAAAQRADSYYIVFNLLVWAGAFAVFYYELYHLPNAIAHIAANPAANSSPGLFGPAYLQLNAEQRIMIHFAALKYYFWTFFFVSIRTAALLFRKALTFMVANIALIVAVALAVLYAISIWPLNESNYHSSGGREWTC
jgi:hypothetical protein